MLLRVGVASSLDLLLDVELRAVVKPYLAGLVFERDTEEVSSIHYSLLRNVIQISVKSPIINIGWFQHFFLM